MRSVGVEHSRFLLPHGSKLPVIRHAYGHIRLPLRIIFRSQAGSTKTAVAHIIQVVPGEIERDKASQPAACTEFVI